MTDYYVQRRTAVRRRTAPRSLRIAAFNNHGSRLHARCSDCAAGFYAGAHEPSWLPRASPSERMVLMMSLLGIVEVELVALCMAMIALKFQEGHSNTLK